MPHISRFNQQTLDTFTCMKNSTEGFYKVDTNDGGYYPYHQVKEYTDIFYNDLKILLDEAASNGLDITTNEIDKSFTLFGQKFYCFCIESQYAASASVKNARYSIVPILYKENFITNPLVNIYEGGSSTTGATNGDKYNSDEYGIRTDSTMPPKGTYHTNCFIESFNRYIHDYHLNYTGAVSSNAGPYTTYFPSGGSKYYRWGYGYVYDYMGFNLTASLCNGYNERNIIRYKVNIYYNETCLYITYKTYYDNYVQEFPLGFFAKGIDIFGNDVLLTTLTPAIFNTGNYKNIYNTTTNALIGKITVWDISSGNSLYDNNTSYLDSFNVLKDPFIRDYKYIDATKFLRIKLQALDGLITFENLIIGEIDKRVYEFTRGEFFTIEDEVYYIPIDINVNTMYPDRATYNYIFMKM